MIFVLDNVVLGVNSRTQCPQNSKFIIYKPSYTLANLSSPRILGIRNLQQFHERVATVHKRVCTTFRHDLF